MQIVLVAAASVVAGSAVNKLSDASGLWTGLVAGGVGLSMFAVVALVEARRSPDLDPGLNRQLGRLIIAAVLAAGLLVGTAQASRWLPCELSFTDADMLFCDNFNDADRGWNGIDDTAGDFGYVDGRMRVVGEPGMAMWVEAPVDIASNSVVVSATGRMVTAGAGVWGVWCRGSADGRTRYEFAVTHTGQAFVKVGDREVAIQQLENFDIGERHTITAFCGDLPGGGAELVMEMDGKRVGRAMDQSVGTLGPGAVGLHASTFGDVVTGSPQARFDLFTARRYRA